MAANTIQVFLHYRHARAQAITQEALATIRRAPRNDRPLLCHLFTQRILRECVRASTKDPQDGLAREEMRLRIPT